MGRFRPGSRVRGRSEFRRAQKQGRKLVLRHFVLLVYARDERVEAPARLGLVVSKRVGNAVRRNRTKRLIREAFRRDPELWPAGTDVIVIARHCPPELAASDVLAEFRAAEQGLTRRATQARKDRENRQSRLAAGT